MVAENWCAAFPHLPTYTQWVSRLHLLTRQVGALLEATCGHDSADARLYLTDSKPIPLCHALRHGRVRLLREDGARFGKTSKGWFFGFKLHAVRHIAGRVMNLILTPANWDDRDPALALREGVDGGVTVADLGYRDADCADRLEEAEMPAHHTGRRARAQVPALAGAAGRGDDVQPVVTSVHRPGVQPLVERAVEHAQAEGAALQPGSCRRRISLSPTHDSDSLTSRSR
jgi:hypothetical protein